MVSFNNYKYLILSICILLLLCGKSQAAMGEPVPGAEVYIELEPDDQPIANGPTNTEGEFSGFIPINPPPAPAPKGIKIFIKFPEKTWKYLATKAKKTDHLGTYHFKMVTTVANKKYEKAIEFNIKTPQDIKRLSMNRSGPYAGSLSNIEEGSTKSLPQKSTRKIPIRIRITCTGINNYGINDEGIK